jgi:cAMP-dependent protein kinase regulator
MMEVEKAEGDNIFEEGDEEGDLFYVIGKGEVNLVKNGEVKQTLHEGDTTQDIMLMYSSEYPETATCAKDTTIFSIDRTTYRSIVAKASKKKRAMYEGFLSNVKFLSGLSKPELLQLADALKPAHYEDGDYMIKHGENGEAFFIIVEGVVQVVGRDAAGEKVDVCTFTVGENIGELEFLNNHKCVADCVAKGPMRAAKMNRHHFEMVMGPVKELLARVAQESTVYEYYRETLARLNAESPTQE